MEGKESLWVTGSEWNGAVKLQSSSREFCVILRERSNEIATKYRSIVLESRRFLTSLVVTSVSKTKTVPQETVPCASNEQVQDATFSYFAGYSHAFPVLGFLFFCFFGHLTLDTEGQNCVWPRQAPQHPRPLSPRMRQSTVNSCLTSLARAYNFESLRE